MKVRAIAPWFGGKRAMADDIVVELGLHRSYWEPFCGSMAVLLAKPPSSHEHVNDLHRDLVNLARVIQHPTEGPRLYRRLRRTLCCEELFQECLDKWRCGITSADDEDGRVELAFNYFVVSWMGRNGVSGTKRQNYQFAKRWTSGGGHGATRVTAAVDSIPAWRRRMRRVTVLSMDAFDLIAKIEDQVGTVLYVDPPYIRGMMSSRSGSSKYEYEFELDDHGRLAELLRRFNQARVVVSYYDHPLLADLYAGWTKREVYRQKNLHFQNRRGASASTAPEVLLMNGPSMARDNHPLFPSPITNH